MIVNLSDLPKPQLPQWAKSWAFDGIVECGEIDISRITHNAIACDPLEFPTGHDLFKKLTAKYDILTDWSGMKYLTGPDDLVVNHCGLNVIEWQRDNWHIFDTDFQDKSKGNCFFGWAGAVRDMSGFIRVPYNYIDPNTGPRTLWYFLAVRTFEHFHYMTYC